MLPYIKILPLAVIVITMTYLSCDTDSEPHEKTRIVDVHQINGPQVPELVSLDTFMLDFMNKWCIPGGQLSISRNDSLLYSRGFGLADMELEIEVNPEHVFRIASVSKYFTFVAILKLIEEGRVELSDKVFGPNGILKTGIFTEYIDKRVEEITIRHLLFHEGGWNRRQGIQPILLSNEIAEELDQPVPKQ